MRSPIQTLQLSSRKLVQDVDVNLATMLKDLQGSMSEMAVSVHQSTTSRSLHKGGLDGRVAKKKPFLKKTHLKAKMEFVRKTSQ